MQIKNSATEEPLYRFRSLYDSPQFFCVGPQRTATTWLFQRLQGRVTLPSGVKETLFFDKHYSKGIKWYLEHFSDHKSGDLWGEIAPTYFHSAEARTRLASSFPDARILISLRNPIERLASLYRLMRQYGWTSETFEECWKTSELMKESSRYGHHIREWIRLFGKQNVEVSLYDDLIRDQQAYLDSICSFLQIPSFQLRQGEETFLEKERAAKYPTIAWLGQRMGDFLRANKFYSVINIAKACGLKRFVFAKDEAFDGSISAATKEVLLSYFAPMIDDLEPLLSRDLSAWRK